MSIDDRPTLAAPDDDPYLWLEEIEGERALNFVDRQNRLTLEKFGDAGFAKDRDVLAAIYDRPDNIPYVTRRGGLLYNLWKDANNPRGLWRRTTLDEFRRSIPKWETVLDLDRLSLDESEDWILTGIQTLPGAHPRAILSLRVAAAMRPHCGNSTSIPGPLSPMGSFCRKQRAAPNGSMPIRCCFRVRMARAWRPRPDTPGP
jgi:hypothetical protein